MPITLYETFRAVFYAPFYAALTLDACGAEGVSVRLATAASTAVTPRALLGGDADLSWGGPMRVLYAHDRDPGCDVVGFCEVVARDPFFIVGREPRTHFAFADLERFRFGTVSEAPTPWLCLQDDIRRAGRDPAAVQRIAGRTMAENAEALRRGELDAAQLAEPFVTRLVRSGAGHVWYAAAARGATSYTTLFTSRRVVAERRPALTAVTRALYRVQGWLRTTSPDTVASTIGGFFPELEPAILAQAIAHYRALGIWSATPVHSRAGFERLRRACRTGGLIAGEPEFARCIDTDIAHQVAAAPPRPL